MKKITVTILIILMFMANNSMVIAINENEQIDKTTISTEEENLQENSEETQKIDSVSKERITTSQENILPYGDGIYRISIASPAYCHLSLESSIISLSSSSVKLSSSIASNL